ncbi:MAG: VanZ family protein [Thermodesulfobacteria bacterium]|nr:VanZ family protein [Thermodesulfobacteriota bacterium]
MLEGSRAPWWGVLLSVLVIVYLTLYPFHFSATPSSFDWSLPLLSSKHHSLFDLASNVLLFVPFGFFLGLAWGPGLSTLVRAAVLALLLSGSVEVVQLFLIKRHPGLSDIVTNVAGALLGAAAAGFVSPKLVWRRSLLPLALAIFFLYEPFFLSFDPGEVWHHLKTWSWGFGPQNILLPAFLLGLWGAWARVPWAAFLLVALFLEGGRLFMVVASLSPLKSLVRIGAASLFYLLLRRDQTKAPWLFALAYLYEALSPFRFSLSFRLPEIVPFAGHLKHLYVGSLLNLFGTLFVFLLWPLVCRRHPLLWASVLALAAEAGQIFVPSRYPDLTTVLLAILGTWTGLKFLLKESRR